MDELNKLNILKIGYIKNRIVEPAVLKYFRQHLSPEEIVQKVLENHLKSSPALRKHPKQQHFPKYILQVYKRVVKENQISINLIKNDIFRPSVERYFEDNLPANLVVHNVLKYVVPEYPELKHHPLKDNFGNYINHVYQYVAKSNTNFYNTKIKKQKEYVSKNIYQKSSQAPKNIKFETVEEFLARGGKINKGPKKIAKGYVHQTIGVKSAA